MGNDRAFATPRLSALLDTQVDRFITQLEEYNAKRPRPRREEDYTYLRSFFKRFIDDQNSRADEIASDAYQNVLQLALAQFPMKTMLNLCIDGRVLPILVFGASAIIGSSVRVPGGMLRDYIRGTDGKLTLRKESYYAGLLDEAFTRFNVPVIAEVFDSHIGCAARLVEEQTKGRIAPDMGLMADVSHKKQIAEATKTFCAAVYENKKRILPIQTSFDPHTGFLYMGLETESAIDIAMKKGGYTEEVLSELVKEKKIILTETLVSIPEVKEMFDDCFFPLDWKHDYVMSAEMFWHGIAAMREKLSPVIAPLLLNIYPHLADSTDEFELERKERLLLLLANAFSGYLLNHASPDEAKSPIPHNHSNHYPFTIHEEEGIDVSEGVYPPNDISMFAVFIRDERNLSANIELASHLVRKNRTDGRVQDTEKLYSDVQAFIEASVPVTVQEIIRDDIPEQEWRAMAELTWDDLPADWDACSDMEFLDYLHTKMNMSAGMMVGINNLRHRMGILYNPAHPTSSYLVEHYKVALPLITGRYRKNQFIVPFVKLGFS